MNQPALFNWPKPKYSERGFGAGKIVINYFEISEEMKPAWTKAIRRWAVIDICGCWEWAGRIHNGYPCVNAAGCKSTLWAHRVSYAVFNGPIDAGMHIDHKCVNPTCVRPDHLQQVTPVENYLLAAKRRRSEKRARINERQYFLF